MPKKRNRQLKPLIDALDFDIGKGAEIAALRAKLAALSEQADAIEDERNTAEAELEDTKAQIKRSRCLSPAPKRRSAHFG